MGSSNVCTGGDTLIFACSGAADVGAVADAAARKMMKDGHGAMFCLAGIGGRVEPILTKTAAAKRILAIDGCALNCTKRCLEQVGLTSFEHMMLGDIGLAKGQAPPTDENIQKTIASAKGKLA